MFTILASHSHPQSQKVLRNLLNSESVKKDPAYTHMIQELGFIENPEKETLELVKNRMKKGHGGR